jgi:hypothetical protein
LPPCALAPPLPPAFEPAPPALFAPALLVPAAELPVALELSLPQPTVHATSKTPAPTDKPRLTPCITGES